MLNVYKKPAQLPFYLFFLPMAIDKNPVSVLNFSFLVVWAGWRISQFNESGFLFLYIKIGQINRYFWRLSQSSVNIIMLSLILLICGKNKYSKCNVNLKLWFLLCFHEQLHLCRYSHCFLSICSLSLTKIKWTRAL